MSEQNPGDVTAHPSPDDPTVGIGGELRAAFAEVHIRDEHPATEAIRHALAEGQRRLAEATGGSSLFPGSCSDRMKKKLPTFRSDREAEAFVESADPTDYNLSGLRQVKIELEKKDVSSRVRSGPGVGGGVYPVVLRAWVLRGRPPAIGGRSRGAQL